jgi:hypothetical protein
MQQAALYTAAAIFAFGAIAHTVRLTSGFPIVIDEFAVPYWVSFPGAVVAAGLAIWMLAAARQE